MDDFWTRLDGSIRTVIHVPGRQRSGEASEVADFRRTAVQFLSDVARRHPTLLEFHFDTAGRVPMSLVWHGSMPPRALEVSLNENTARMEWDFREGYGPPEKNSADLRADSLELLQDLVLELVEGRGTPQPVGVAAAAVAGRP